MSALADAADKETALSYQQVVNVSRVSIDEQLRQGQESLARRNVSLGVGGAGGLGGGEARYFSILPKEVPERLGEVPAQGRDSDQKAQVQQQARRRLRTLVLLQSDVKALEAKADVLPPPVEAPQPAQKKG